MVTPATIMSAKQYEAFAVTEEGRRVELHGGRLVEKPDMSIAHEWWQSRLAMQLGRQLDPAEYLVQSGARLKRDDEHYFIPDVAVVPVTLINPNREQWRGLNLFDVDQPLPLVVEIWSPSTGTYDDDLKFPVYQQRGDLEIWRLHPYDKTLTVWRRQAGGTYREATYRSGRLSLFALPDVVIDLDALFA